MSFIANDKPMMNVLMLGASSVGKSSMLAAMYDEVKNIDLVSLNCSSPKLEQELRAKVRAMQSASASISNKGGIEGTSGKHRYVFNLSAPRSNKEKLDICFTDIPGGWVTAEEKQVELLAELDKSHVIILPIHAPALMEQEGFFHQEVNDMDSIYWFLKEHDFNRPILILLAPIKCESYMEKRQDELLARLQSAYNDIIQLISEFPDVALAVTPVETMGNMRFHSWQDGVDKYFRVGKNPYKPRFVEQPLCYALNFILTQSLSNRSFVRRHLDILPFVNLDDKELKSAALELSKRTKRRGEGFLCLQGGHLLRSGGL